MRNGRLPPERLSIEFVGMDGVGLLAEYRARTWFRHEPQCSHHEAVARMQAADVLLLFVPADGAHDLTGKIFEYLKSARPILALVPPESDAAHIVNSARAGVVVPPDDHAAIGTALMNLYDDWQRGQLYVHPDENIVRAFDRRELTRQLANILDELTMPNTER